MARTKNQVSDHFDRSLQEFSGQSDIQLDWKAASLHALEYRGDALAAADAHGDQAIAPATALQFIHGLDGENATGGADGMAQSNRAAVGIDFLRIHPEFLA